MAVTTALWAVILSKSSMDGPQARGYNISRYQFSALNIE
jgi:hypothetical protein